MNSIYQAISHNVETPLQFIPGRTVNRSLIQVQMVSDTSWALRWARSLNTSCFQSPHAYNGTGWVNLERNLQPARSGSALSPTDDNCCPRGDVSSHHEKHMLADTNRKHHQMRKWLLSLVVMSPRSGILSSDSAPETMRALSTGPLLPRWEPVSQTD